MICDEQFELNTQLLLDHMLDTVLVLDDQLRIVVFNSAAESMFRYEANEMLGESVLKLVDQTHWPHVEQFLGANRATLLSGKPTELPCIRSDGKSLTVETLTSSLYTDDAEYLLTIARDVTDIKKITTRLALEHQANQLLLSSIGSLLITISEVDVIDNFNPVAEKILGVSRSEVVGKRISDSKLNWNLNGLYKKINEATEKKCVQKLDSLDFTSRTGQPGVLELTLHPVFHPESGVYRGILILGEDVTDKRMQDVHNAHVQKLESIGELAAGIAHEINTPIQYIENNTSFIQDSFNDLIQYINKLESFFSEKGSISDPECYKELEELKSTLDIDYIVDEIPISVEQSLTGISRVSQIVGAMKTFAHPETETKTLVDINKLVDTVITISTNEWKYCAHVEKDLDPELTPVLAYSSDLQHAILNIVVNAAHAIQERKSSVQESSRGIIEVRTVKEDNSVSIYISDNGPGVPLEIRKRIFDPFFTTKTVGKGTGQGLSIAHAAVVTKLGGQLQIKDADLGGAEFIIRIPLLNE